MLHFNEKEIRTLLPEVDEILPIAEVGFNQKVDQKRQRKCLGSYLHRMQLVLYLLHRSLFKRQRKITIHKTTSSRKSKN